MKQATYKVFRFDELIATVKASDKAEARSKVIEQWGRKKFGKSGARSSEDARKIDEFLHAIFIAEKVRA